LCFFVVLGSLCDIFLKFKIIYLSIFFETIYSYTFKIVLYT
jgi:hypothetical protein